MWMFKTATAFTSLLIFSIAPVYSQTNFPQSSGDSAGLRIKIDEHGNRTEAFVPAPPESLPKQAQADFSTTAASAMAASMPRRVPQVVETKSGVGKVVRLNGLFRAGSRATVKPDGKIQSDCHVTPGSAEGASH